MDTPPTGDALLVERFGTLSVLGAGGMGEVYRGYDHARGMAVAVKRMRHVGAEMRARLRREARALQRLAHPHVCPLLEWFEQGDAAWLVMPVIEGKPLGKIAADIGIDELVPLFEQICDGVEAAHALGLVHRDLKPSNILVERRAAGWHAWVMDFGIARSDDELTLTGSHEVLGTPGYMAPEQARGESHRVDVRCDVYGIGATLFHALTGTPPHGSGSVAEVLAHVLDRDVPSPRELRPEVPEGLARIVVRCLEREPARRYADVAALRRDLRAFRSGGSVSAPSTGPWFQMQRVLRRHPRFWGGIAALLVLVAGTLTYAVWAQLRSADQALQMARSAALAERVRGGMALARLAPLHDIEAERAGLRTALAQLVVAVPPRDPTLRRAHLRALRDAQVDLDALDAALSPARQLAEATGAALDDRLRYLELALRRYAQMLRPFQSLPRDERESLLRDARERVLRPALTASAGVDLPPILVAYRALADGDLAQAAVAAERVQSRDVSDTGAFRLGAALAAARAQAAADRGDHGQARIELAQARAALTSAIAIQRSDPELFQQSCSLAAFDLAIVSAEAERPPPDPGALSAHCAAAVAADPTAAATADTLASAWISIAMAAHQRNHHDAARAAYTAAIAQVQAALTAGSASDTLRLQGGRAELGLARLLLHDVAQAEVHYGRAIDSLALLATSAPGYLPAQITLADAYRDRGRLLANHRRPVEPDYAAAERHLRHVLVLDPDSVQASEALSRLLLFRFYDARDRDPERARNFAVAAIAAQQTVLDRWPERVEALFTQAANHGDLWMFESGRDGVDVAATLPLLETALAGFARLRQLAPQRPDGYGYDLGFRAQAAELLRVADLPRNDILSPVPTLIAEAQRHDVQLTSGFVAWALTERAIAFAERADAETDAAFALARVWLDRGLAMEDDRYDSIRMSLPWSSHYAGYLLSRGRSPEAVLRFGETLLREARAHVRGKGDNIIACEGAEVVAQRAQSQPGASARPALDAALQLFADCERLGPSQYLRYAAQAAKIRARREALAAASR